MENTRSIHRRPLSTLEPLEQRIAPAQLTGFRGAVSGSAILLQAGTANAGLSTSDQGGSYLLYVHKGYALVFTTDLNGNNQVDMNEITGIAAGPGLQLTSFVDIHGDIVTNLNPDFTLTDSDGNASNGRDGRVLLPNKIEKIELRSITAADLPAGARVSDRLALSSYSIFGNIHAGGGFGMDKGGLLIDTTGSSLQADKYEGGTGSAKYEPTTPQIGSIFAGSAASYEAFSFGTAAPGKGLGFNGGNIRGELRPLVAAAGVDGADIVGVRSANDALYNLGTLKAGDGGAGGRGGDIKDVRIPGDKAGGYALIAGNAGTGLVGKRGGEISNFADLGSQTGYITLKSGRGGDSLLGVGGDGGLINFDKAVPQNFSARIEFVLGDGGTGLTGGGKGGAMPNAKITMPANDPTYPLAMVSSIHRPGGIGVADPVSFKLSGFDFDKDGFNDAVYTTADPNQLVVLFGAFFEGDPAVDTDDRYGFDTTRTIQLNGPSNASALTVGDFNGDGFVDIATASASASSAGVYVFMSLKDRTDPTRFNGFAQPIMTPLPAYTNLAVLEKSVPILSLAAGEFDGRAGVDLAVVSVQESRFEGAPSGPTLTFLINETVDGKGSGYFYTERPFFTAKVNPELPLVKATSLVGAPLGAGQSDWLSLASAGTKEDPVPRGVTFFNYKTGTSVSVDSGKVDTDRVFNDPTKTPPDHTALTAVTLKDWAVYDADGDNDADLVALTESPVGFLVTFSGNGAGVFTKESSPEGDDNSGIKVAGDLTEGGLGWLVGSTKGMLASRNATTGRMDQMTLVSYEAPATGSTAQSPFVEVRLNPAMDTATLGVSYGNPHGDEDLRSFDIYAPREGSFASYPNTYLLASPTKDASPTSRDQNFIFGYGEVSGYLADQMNYELHVNAGNGGRGLTGAGGAGGSVGDKLLNVKGVATGSFDLLFPNTSEHGYRVTFNAGDGGEGFLNGGAGGAVKGLSVAYPPEVGPQVSDVRLAAGGGGASGSGKGGQGGDLTGFIVQSGSVFRAGAGGGGYIGGAGGSIRGDTLPELVAVTANTLEPAVWAYAGDGGSGLSDAGAGGGILKLRSLFLPVIGGEGGQLTYIAGNGGSSASGKGGVGGSVTGSSPADGGNNLGGSVYLQAGNGGSGASGGNGGAVSEFYNQPTTGTPPSVLTILAGNGGSGVSGNGGTGGAVSKINATAGGLGVSFTEFYRFERSYYYNRIVAGNGGDSTGAAGGVGGGVSEVTSSASASGSVVAAGRGGDGLAAGGIGGSVAGTSKARLSLNAAGSSKLVVIAGDGGNATAALPVDNDPLAYGPADGKAGDGGSISNLTQPQSINTRVDLIAGNGGNTPNYGTSSSKTGVGNGGSITNVDITGDIGNIGAAVAIKSYNDIKTNQRMADFVQSFVRDNLSSAVPNSLTDSIGNVGIVVGSNGRVRDNNNDGILDPSGSGTTGVLTDIKFRNLMSAVAGSVDRVNSIREVSRLTSSLGTGGVYGADKGVGGRDYVSADAVLSWLKTPGAARPSADRISLEIGGALVDGAIVRSNAPATFGERDFVLG
jgi:hypothetical protein